MPQLSALLLIQQQQPESSIFSSIPNGSSSSHFSASMERTSQWVSAQDVPTDLVIRIGDAVFPLHKAVMVPNCGYIRKAVVAAARGDPAATVELDLSALPGGADAFEKAARYCYGANFEISARNAAALLCAADFLDMRPADGGVGMARRVEEFLAQAGLRTLPSAVAVLRSCEGQEDGGILIFAQELGVVQRAADAIALRICNEALFPTRSPPEWWAAELAALSPASFHKVVTALRCRRADPEVVATAATSYAELVLVEEEDGDDAAARRARVESVVAVLPSADHAPLPAAFLCRLLHVAVTVDASAKTCRDLELRVAAVLDQATSSDLLSVVLDGAGERVMNIDTVRRIITAFVEREASSSSSSTGGGRSRRASLSGDEAAASAGKLQKVAKIVDELAAEVATEETLPISKFVALAGAVPKEARATHDCVYRAVDVYLKAHPGLDEIEREKVCGVMDTLKLSYQARLHAAQNKRLPLQAVLSALYYDQLKLRSAGAGDDSSSIDARSEAGSARMQAKADASLARENEALRAELAMMRASMTGSGNKQNSKGSGSRSSATATKKKASSSLLGSVSRTLSRLNPFRSKDTSAIADVKDGMHVVKPKRRRFSIS